MTHDSHTDDEFKNEDVRVLTRKQIVRSAAKEGGVKKDGDAFIVRGERYEPIDDDVST